ncbi:hypothetical protein RYX36_005790, partial [Vicia faba]
IACLAFAFASSACALANATSLCALEASTISISMAWLSASLFKFEMIDKDEETSRKLARYERVTFHHGKVKSVANGKEFHVIISSTVLIRNNLTTFIPNNIGHMPSLELLDWSKNHFCGRIPLSISNLTFLNYTNLSFNNLEGEIPLSTQLQSHEYIGAVWKQYGSINVV